MEIPKIIWIYWAQGWDNATEISKLCLESWICHNRLWKVIKLSNHNIRDYLNIDEITDNFFDKKPLSCTCDLLNINLLAKWGGVWVDATVFCCKPLDSWLNSHTETGLFMHKRIKQDMLIDTWFIACTQNNYTIKKWCDVYTKYWYKRSEPDNYFDFYDIFKQLYLSDTEIKNSFDNIPIIDANKAHELQVIMYNDVIKLDIQKYEMFKLRNNVIMHDDVIKKLLPCKYDGVICDNIYMKNNADPPFMKYLRRLTGFPGLFYEISEYENKSIEEIKQQYFSINCCKYVKWTNITNDEFIKCVDNYDKDVRCEDLLNYYAKTRNYVYELAEYHSTKERNLLSLIFVKIMKDYNLLTVLDFGCGIGQDTIIANINGLICSACDIEGYTFDFAKWRFKKHNFNVDTIGITIDGCKLGMYDAVTCFEVIMHVPHIENTLLQLYNCLNVGGLLFITWRFKNNYSLALNKNIKYDDTIKDLIKNIGFEFVNLVHVWGPLNENGKYLYIFTKPSHL